MSGKAGPGTNPASGTPAGGTAVQRVWEACSTALSWMTILPFAGAREYNRQVGGRAMAALPLAGVVIGSISALAALAFHRTPLVAAAVALVVSELLTRFMHVDAVADVADALGSYAKPEKAREILRDSHSGAFAVAAVALIYIVIFASFASALSVPGPAEWTVFFSLWAGRVAGLVPATTTFDPLSESGFGGLIIGTVHWWWIGVWWAVLSAASLPVCGPWIAVSSAFSLASVYVLSRHMSSRFDGLNGDCVGACVLLGTVITAAMSCALVAL